MDTATFVAIFDALESHALASGLFEAVNGHEPKSAPGNGISAAIWADSIDPVPAGSGLASTTARLVFNIRIYSNMLQEPQDAIDPAVLNAVANLMTAYSGDFTLGGLVRQVDLHGMAGRSMRAQAGYLQQDNRIYRVMTVDVPVIVNDVFTQAP